jgi:hypothetical protein
MQLDIFLPRLMLALEYQGEQHFFDVVRFAPQRQYAARDEQKRIACKEIGITLVEIPFWWDFRLSSLRTTLHQVRPDLVPVPGDSAAIPKNPPSRRMKF